MNAMQSITLYGLRIQPNGHVSRIHAIKALRAIAAMHGAELPLRSGKFLIDNIDASPIVIECEKGEWPIVRMLVGLYFNLDAPMTLPAHLGNFYTYPERREGLHVA